MQVLGGTSDNLRSSDILYLTATTPDGKQSRAALAYNLAADKDYEASEDAELFLDSNLSDVLEPERRADGLYRCRDDGGKHQPDFRAV